MGEKKPGGKPMGLSGKIGVSISSSDCDEQATLDMDVTNEASADPELNGTLFVEDECDEFDEELEM